MGSRQMYGNLGIKERIYQPGVNTKGTTDDLLYATKSFQSGKHQKSTVGQHLAKKHLPSGMMDSMTVIQHGTETWPHQPDFNI